MQTDSTSSAPRPIMIVNPQSNEDILKSRGVSLAKVAIGKLDEAISNTASTLDSPKKSFFRERFRQLTKSNSQILSEKKLEKLVELKKEMSMLEIDLTENGNIRDIQTIFNKILVLDDQINQNKPIDEIKQKGRNNEIEMTQNVRRNQVNLELKETNNTFKNEVFKTTLKEINPILTMVKTAQQSLDEFNVLYEKIAAMPLPTTVREELRLTHEKLSKELKKAINSTPPNLVDIETCSFNLESAKDQFKQLFSIIKETLSVHAELSKILEEWSNPGNEDDVSKEWAEDASTELAPDISINKFLTNRSKMIMADEKSSLSSFREALTKFNNELKVLKPPHGSEESAQIKKSSITDWAATEKIYNDQINHYQLVHLSKDDKYIVSSDDKYIVSSMEFISNIRVKKKELEKSLNDQLDKAESNEDLIKAWDVYLRGVEELAEKIEKFTSIENLYNEKISAYESLISRLSSKGTDIESYKEFIESIKENKIFLRDKLAEILGESLSYDDNIVAWDKYLNGVQKLAEEIQQNLTPS